MFLNFRIVSTIICGMCFFTTYIKLRKEILQEFTKEELENYIKKRKDSYEWYINVFFFVCPIINIIFVLTFGFFYQ